MNEKNRITTMLSFLVLLLCAVVHLLHRVLNMGEIWGHVHQLQTPWVTNLYLAVPVILFAVTAGLHRLRPDHSQIPLLNTLTMTMSSIGMIAGGSGMVEYHFSIFMVVAIAGYYERVKLVVIMTAIFAVQHLAGYAFFSEYVFGVAREDYSFSMVLIHAVFLLGTSGAVIWQIVHKRNLRSELDETVRQQELLQQMMRQMDATSGQLAAASTDLNTSYDSSRTELEQVVNQIREISEQAEAQSGQAEQSARVVDEIAGGINRIADTVSSVSMQSAETAAKADQGIAMLQRTIEQIEAIHETVQASTEVIGQLNSRSMEIHQMANLITDIAAQTNLLALNAAIEAARAGEHGKGFTVVANEVRKLADQSARSAAGIAELVQAIESDASRSARSMDQVMGQVRSGLEVVTSTGTLLKQMMDEITDAAAQFQQVSSSTETVAAGAEQASAVIAEMTRFVSHVTEKTQAVAATSERQFRSIEALSSLIATLNEITLQLRRTSS